MKIFEICCTEMNVSNGEQVCLMETNQEGSFVLDVAHWDFDMIVEERATF